MPRWVLLLGAVVLLGLVLGCAALDLFVLTVAVGPALLDFILQAGGLAR